LRKAEPHQLASLKLLVTGAEKLPAGSAESVEERFGIKVLQGYGLTETSPVAGVNLPEPQGEGIPCSRAAAMARSASSLLAWPAQIRDPESGAVLSLHDTGMLWLKGPERLPRLPERSGAQRRGASGWLVQDG
jgi:acyl-[acyl-carrier-protein]-phospholipid O-acyltransferase/long-chain-fatty-acid--[acyl-carrier-protein] ligase